MTYRWALAGTGGLVQLSNIFNSPHINNIVQ